MKIGYFWHGGLSDETTTCDLGKVTRWSIVIELQRRGHEVLSLRECEADPWFGLFAENVRADAYQKIRRARHDEVLDVVVVEWDTRAPLTEVIERTQQLDDLTKNKTEIVVIDIDHTVVPDDEKRWNLARVLEPFVRAPRFMPSNHIASGLPLDKTFIDQRVVAPDGARVGCLDVGVEAARSVDKLVIPVGTTFPGEVHVYQRGHHEDSPEICDNVQFFNEPSLAVIMHTLRSSWISPVVVGQRSLQYGYLPPWWPALLAFGGHPVIHEDHRALTEFVPPDCVAEDSWDLLAILRDDELGKVAFRRDVRVEVIRASEDLLSPVRFVDQLLGIE